MRSPTLAGMSATYPGDLSNTVAVKFYGPHIGSHLVDSFSSGISVSLMGICEGIRVDAPNARA